jgi:hypothetical protein
LAIIAYTDLKVYLGIAVSDSTDDTNLTAAAAASCVWVQKTCGRSFEVTNSGSESARVYRPRSATLVITDDFSSTSNLVVKTDAGDDGNYETTLTYNTDYIVEPLNGLEDGLTQAYRKVRCVSWLFPTCNIRPSVQVTARWGWTAVPDAVKQAALIEGARLFRRRTSPEGISQGFGDYGGVPIRQREDPDALALLNPYIRSETALYT